MDLTFDLLATVAGGVSDRLSNPVSASDWLSSARGVPADISTLSTAELTRLRQLRDDLRASLHGEDIPNRTGSVVVELDHNGTASLAPSRANGQRLVSQVLLEVAVAQHDKTWPRVKLCRNARCDGVFYDRSRNNSGVWHDVKTCGNVENLRTSRARRRVAQVDLATNANER